jgi:hypothetical protein
MTMRCSITFMFVVLSVLLLGCVVPNTPGEVTDEGTRSSHMLTLAPVVAVGCMTRYIENYSAAFQGNTDAD